MAVRMPFASFFSFFFILYLLFEFFMNYTVVKELLPWEKFSNKIDHFEIKEHQVFLEDTNSDLILSRRKILTSKELPFYIQVQKEDFDSYKIGFGIKRMSHKNNSTRKVIQLHINKDLQVENTKNSRRPKITSKNIKTKTSFWKPMSIAKPFNITETKSMWLQESCDQQKNNLQCLECGKKQAVCSQYSQKIRTDTKLLDCDKWSKTDTFSILTSSIASTTIQVKCCNYNRRRKTISRHNYFGINNYVVSEFSSLCNETVTLATHADSTFIKNLPNLLSRWNDAPVSVAVYAPGTDFTEAVKIIKNIRECLSSKIKQYVTFHMFFDKDHIPPHIPSQTEFEALPTNCSVFYLGAETSYKHTYKLHYPINTARNIARYAAMTYFVLSADIELLPSANLAQDFMKMVQSNPRYLQPYPYQVFMVISFEINEDGEIPIKKKKLISLYDRKKASLFHIKICRRCYNFKKLDLWMQRPLGLDERVFTSISRKSTYKSMEPVFIGTHHDPPYDDRLFYEGLRDKRTQGYAMCLQNYTFNVLTEHFMVHNHGIKAHKNSSERTSKENIEYLKQIATIRAIKEEYNVIYGRNSHCIT